MAEYHDQQPQSTELVAPGTELSAARQYDWGRVSITKRFYHEFGIGPLAVQHAFQEEFNPDLPDVMPAINIVLGHYDEHSCGDNIVTNNVREAFQAQIDPQQIALGYFLKSDLRHQELSDSLQAHGKMVENGLGAQVVSRLEERISMRLPKYIEHAVHAKELRRDTLPNRLLEKLTHAERFRIPDPTPDEVLRTVADEQTRRITRQIHHDFHPDVFAESMKRLVERV